MRYNIKVLYHWFLFALDVVRVGCALRRDPYARFCVKCAAEETHVHED